MSLVDLLFRFGLVPTCRVVGASRGEIFSDVGIVFRIGKQRMLLHRLADDLIARVAHAVVAGQPATLLGEQRHLAVVKHDREAIFVERRLFARPHRLVVAIVPIPFPLLPIEAHVIVHAPFAIQMRSSIESGNRRTRRRARPAPHTNRAVLAGNRRRFEVATFDDLFAASLLGAFVAGETRLSLAHQRGAGMGGTEQPVVSRQPRIEQRDRFRRDFRPVDALWLDGKCRADKSQRQTDHRDVTDGVSHWIAPHRCWFNPQIKSCHFLLKSRVPSRIDSYQSGRGFKCGGELQSGPCLKGRD